MKPANVGDKSSSTISRHGVSDGTSERSVHLDESRRVDEARHSSGNHQSVHDVLVSNAASAPRARHPALGVTKRLLDIGLVTLGGILLSPLILVTALCVKLSSPGPIFYGQDRIGRDGARFRTWKFRTMRRNADELLELYLDQDPVLREQWERERKLNGDPRVIPGIGRILRRTSMDELPQLWNVLRGEMSLVGPRPLPDYHLDHFDAEFRQYRQQVRPGVTGLWQVMGRRNGRDESYLRWDVDYVRNWSHKLDGLILLRTLKAVWAGDGASK